MTRPISLLTLGAALLILPLAGAAAQGDGKGAADQKGLLPPPKAWAAQVTPAEFTLVWRGVPSATAYEVLVRNAQGQLIRLGMLSASGARFIVPLARLSALGIVLDRVQFAVRALNGARQGPLAMFNPVSTAKQSAAKAVVAPGNAMARETAPGIVTLTWDEVEGATAYAVGRAVGQYGFRRFCDLCPTGGLLVDTVPTAGTHYVYSITALTPNGRSRPAITGRVEVTGLATDRGGTVVTGSGPRLDPKSAVERVSITARPLHSRVIQVLVSFAAQHGGLAGEVVRKMCDGSEQVIRRFDALVPLNIEDQIGGTNLPECNAVEKQRVRYFVRIRDAKGAVAQSKEALADMSVASAADTPANVPAADAKGLAAGITVTPRVRGTGALAGVVNVVVTIANRLGLGATVNMATQLMRKVCNGPWTVVRPFSLSQSVVDVEDIVSEIDQQCGAIKPTVQYQVRVADPKGLVANSKAATVTIPDLAPAATEPPATPGNRRLARTSDGRRILTWSAVSGATGYRIERIAGAKGAWTVVKELPSTATTWTDAAKVDGAPQYRITAINRAGNSATGSFR